MFQKIFDLDVSENSGTPKSFILIEFSIINHPFWGTPILETPIWRHSYHLQKSGHTFYPAAVVETGDSTLSTRRSSTQSHPAELRKASQEMDAWRKTPLKINMKHNHGGLEDDFPFQTGDF